METKTLADIVHNTRIKTYPDGSQIVTVASAPIFREPGWELSDKWDKEPRPASEQSERAGEAEDRERARRRARAAVADLGRSNAFQYFVTLTLDPEKINRYDEAITRKELRRWLSHQVQRRGLLYVLVPERHKDGAIHFHGMINGALPLIDSGTVKPPEGGKPKRPRSAAQRAAWLENGGQICYNISSWPYGFTSAFELVGDYRKAVAYVCKYIGKDAEKIGGRYYFSGGDLRRPEKSYTDTDFAAMEAETGAARFMIPRLGCQCINVEKDVDNLWNTSEPPTNF